MEVRLKGQNLPFPNFFFKLGHDAYIIKLNHECSTVVANILHRHPSDSGGGLKRSKFIFQNMVMLRIKLNGIMNAAAW